MKARIPGLWRLKELCRFIHEYYSDFSFFLNNYAYSKKSENKIGYKMLFLVHSLEKGMSVKNPRIFGLEKTNDLMALAEEYESFHGNRKSFAYQATINVLRSYVNFFAEKGWQNIPECVAVQEFISDREGVENISVGSHQILTNTSEKWDYSKLLESRHSVREFQDKEVREEDLQLAVKDAILSPSACNRQMIKVYYVKNREKRNYLISQAKGFTAFDKSTINLMLVTFDTNAFYTIGERNQGWFNAGLFSMNLVNSLHTKGIGTCFCQFGNSFNSEKEIKKVIGISSGERIAVIIAFGYYCDRQVVPYSPRKTLSDVYHLID